MLQWFIRFAEVRDFIHSSRLHFGKTLLLLLPFLSSLILDYFLKKDIRIEGKIKIK